jgi:hypothetical protein
VKEAREGEGGSHDDHNIIDETTWNVGDSETNKFAVTSSASIAPGGKIKNGDLNSKNLPS